MIDEPPPLEDRGRDTVLCALGALADPGSKGFRIGRRERMFVVRKDGEVYGYVNLCPHQGTTLDWKIDAFLTVEKDYIICATHAAHFEIDNGLCIWGPCLHRSLAPVGLRIENGLVMLDE